MPKDELEDKNHFLRRLTPASVGLGLGRRHYERFPTKLQPNIPAAFFRACLNVMIRR